MLESNTGISLAADFMERMLTTDHADGVWVGVKLLSNPTLYLTLVTYAITTGHLELVFSSFWVALG